jgi:hypothetical protein
VQAAVNAASSGDVVLVAAGTYVEQVVVNGKDLTIQGAGAGATTIQSPAVLATSFATPTVRKPVVLCENSNNIVVRDLTVDGNGMGNANNSFVGAAWWNAGGQLLNATVTRVRDNPFSGVQHGVAVYCYNNTSGPYALEVGSVTMADFQKNAMALNGTGMTVNVHDCTITGQGPTTVTAQNGIQVSFGAGGTLTNDAISAINYTPNSAASCGVLVYQSTNVAISGGSVSNCQSGIYYEDGSGSITGTSQSGSMWSTTLYNDLSSAPNAVRSAPSRPAAEPLAEDGGAAMVAKPTTASAYSFTLSGGCVSGSGAAGSQGIWLGTEGGGATASVSGVELTNWDQAFATYGAVAMTAQHNSITGSISAGFDNSASLAAQDASYNWWGAASGPGGAGGGSGGAVLPVSGSNVTFSPWLVSGTDLVPGCGFSSGPDNVVSVGPAPSCVSIANTCILLPVTIHRTTSDNVRGYSITFQLSSNLQLCSGTSSVTQGSYLSSVSGTHFEVVDNGGGSYTVDCAILGLPCGATTVNGTLFNLSVKKSGALDGTGTVTLSAPTMRDCDNGAVAVSVGSPLSISIDTATPVAIANLASSPLQNGNDADGTSKITLSFTAPGDAASVEVYRAPFGHYPEYDDAGGAVPATPSYPPGAPWTLTGVTASGQSDEPAVRDFWYYVAFSRDACGNVSAVSNKTSGALDYHLGDVVDPGNPSSVGDNHVDGADISRLGSHYGISLVLNDPYNYLDVGPTTNSTVNGRPTTDNKVGFEDLILFSIDYGQVSAPQMAAVPVGSEHDAIALDVPELPGVGMTFPVAVRVRSAGDLQGASVRLAFDPARVEPVGVEAGTMLASQGAPSIVLSPEPGTVDFSLLGTGSAFRGEGDAAHVLFRVKAAGDAGIGVASLLARDTHNAPVTLDPLAGAAGPQLPTRTELGIASPNPFTSQMALRLTLAREGTVKVGVYDLLGRRVRSLMDSVQPAGVRSLVWDGRNDAGARLSPGVYLVRMVANGVTQSRRVQFVP